jgi:endonuclease YncB( thermonuclease family)
MYKKKFRAKVVGVQDGDTLRLANRTGRSSFVRLARVNAPELNQAGGRRAKQSLSRKALGRTMTFYPVGKSYGRTVARVPGLARKLPPKKGGW